MIGFLVNIFLVGVFLVLFLGYLFFKWVLKELEKRNTPPSRKLTADDILSWYDYDKEEREKFYKEQTDPKNPNSYLNILKRNYW